MHQYQIKTCCLLAASFFFLRGWICAYVPGEHAQTSADFHGAPMEDEKSVLQVESKHQIPLSSLISSFEGLLNDPDNKRSSEGNPAYDGLPTVQHHAGCCAYALYLIKPAKAFCYAKSSSIYLLDCAFLI